MKKQLDKLSKTLKFSKTSVMFLFGLMIIGIISGSLFSLVITKADQSIVNKYLETFINSINNNSLIWIDCFKSSIIFNYIFILVIWLLGISVIGVPIILFMFFGKSFCLGFTISAIIKKYGIEGCLLSLVYLFPHYIANVIVILILTIYAITLSIKIVRCIIKPKTLDFKPIVKKYFYVLIMSIIIVLVTCLYEAYFMPKVLKIILNFIK